MEQQLKELGLSEYESKVYMALIRSGTLTGLKASKLSGVPQGKIYDTLYRLAEKGMVSIMNVHPKLFKAVNPEIAIKGFIKSKKEHLQELEQNLPKQIKNLRGLQNEETDEKVSVFTGRKNAFAQHRYLLETAKKSMDIMFTFEIIQPATKRILQEKREKLNIRIIATKKDNMLL